MFTIVREFMLIHKDDLGVYETAKDQAAFWGYDIDDIPEPDGFVDEGDNIEVGNLSFKVMHTPGHSPGGICLYGEGILISGDTIFKGSVGRTDFPGGSMEKLKNSFRLTFLWSSFSPISFDTKKPEPNHSRKITLGRFNPLHLKQTPLEELSSSNGVKDGEVLPSFVRFSKRRCEMDDLNNS